MSLTDELRKTRITVFKESLTKKSYSIKLKNSTGTY